jgi:hypothetical protein
MLSIAETVRRSSATDPKPHLERKLTEVRALLSLDFESANKTGSSAQLVNGEQSQRVSHQHADTCVGWLISGARILESAQHQGECG